MPLIKYLELSSGLDLNHAGLRVSPALQDGFRLVIPDGLPVAAPFHEIVRGVPAELLHARALHLGAPLVRRVPVHVHAALPAGVLLPAAPSAESWRRVSTLVVYAPIVPLVLIQLVLRPYWPGIQNLYDDWANFAYYTIYLFAGFLLARHPAPCEEVAQREWRRALVLGVATCGCSSRAVLRL